VTETRGITVLFTDLVDSTAIASSLTPDEADELRHRHFHTLDGRDKTVREPLRRFRGDEIKTTEDGFAASVDGPARAIRCAQGIFEGTGKLGVQLRTGLHTVECEVRGDDLGGSAVDITARVAARAGPGRRCRAQRNRSAFVNRCGVRGIHEFGSTSGASRWTTLPSAGAASLSPTPAGIGGVEVAMVAALAAVGVKDSSLITAVLLYRIISLKGAVSLWAVV
jgi:class 3 adenylate cyclase